MDLSLLWWLAFYEILCKGTLLWTFLYVKSSHATPGRQFDMLNFLATDLFKIAHVQACQMKKKPCKLHDYFNMKDGTVKFNAHTFKT